MKSMAKGGSIALALFLTTGVSAQPCPQIEEAATSSYSATFSKADASVLQDRWNALMQAVERCQALRGKPVSLEQEIGSDFYRRLKSPEQVIEAEQSEKRLRVEHQLQGKGLFVHAQVFGQLTSADQESLRNRYPMLQVAAPEMVGKVLSYQVNNTSIAGHNAGSRLGAVVGQTSYIDKAIAGGTYSATGQLSAGIVGAALGAVFDKQEQRSYTISYAIQLLDGSVKQIEHTSRYATTRAAEACVWTSDFSDAPAYLCNDTLLGFLSRVRSLEATYRTASTSATGAAERVRCKAEGIGVVEIPAAECKALLGTELK